VQAWAKRLREQESTQGLETGDVVTVRFVTEHTSSPHLDLILLHSAPFQRHHEIGYEPDPLMNVRRRRMIKVVKNPQTTDLMLISAIAICSISRKKLKADFPSRLLDIRAPARSQSRMNIAL
jgi:hypothetical protein